MQNLKRLIIKGVVSESISSSVTWLMENDGLCTCGRWLRGSDAKFILANIGPRSSHIPERKDSIVIAAYCYGCFSTINNAMKQCRNIAYREKRSEGELRE